MELMKSLFKVTDMGMFRLPMLAVAILTAGLAFGTEYFVDEKRPNDDGDGTSETTAKHTIQAAVSLATKPGDIVTVLPGVYTEGGDEVDGKGYARVCVKTPGILIRSKCGKEVTHIVGQKATVPKHASGMGDDAVRCVYFANIPDGNPTSRIEGFTIRNGCTRWDPKAGSTAGGAEVPQNKGGGVCYRGDNSPDSTKIYVVDCVITNCAGTRGGGAYGVTAVRTYFGNNTGSVNGSASRHVRHLNCVIGANESLAYHTLVVNCSFVGYNSFVTKNVFSGASGEVYNILVQSSAAPQISVDNGVTFTKLVNAVFTHEPSAAVPADCLNVTVGVGDIFMAMALGDWRPRADVDAVMTGKVADLVKTGRVSAAEVAEFCGVDYAGCPRDLSSESTSVGAFMPATPTCAFSVLKPNADGNVTIDGHPLPTGVLTNTVYSDVWPTQYLVCAKGLISNTTMPIRYRQYRRSDGFGGTGSFQESVWRRLMPKWPEESLWLAPERNGHTMLQIETSSIYWIDAENGSDDNDGSTREKAFKTWQKAGLEVNSSTGVEKRNYVIFMFCPGVYGEEQGVYDAGANGKSRIACPTGWLRLIGIDGPEKTIIRGAADPEAMDKDGCGPNAVRCIYGGSNFSMQGFTLTDGHSGGEGGTSTTPNAAGSGGAVCGTQTSILVDCIISNNVARRAAAVYGGVSSYATLRNCIVADNRTALFDEGALRKCYVVGSLLCNNSGTSGAASIGHDCSVFNTTVIEPQTDKGKPVYGATSIKLFNSILQGGVGPGATGVGKVVGCLFDGFYMTNPSGGYVFGNPAFVDPVNGDFHLCNASPALGLGESVGVDEYTYFLGNIDANATEWTNDGHTTAGCCQSPYVESICVGTDIPGTVEPCGGIPAVAGSSVTVTVMPSKTGRPYVGLEVDGTLLPAVTSYTVTVPDPMPADWSASVRAVFGTNFYVNAETGDDSAFGGSWATARKTLKGALASAIRGDTVYLAPGTYEEGEMIQEQPIKKGCVPYLKCRAYVPSGVTLTSSNGLATVATTIIRGASATADPDGYGMGANAVRGVFLENDATLCGVTVAGGRVDSGAGAIPEDDNHHGAGVLCRDSSTSVIRDCILTDNIAPRGGATRYGALVHCVCSNNQATVNAAGSRDGSYYECYFADNKGSSTISFWTEINGCTFGESDSGAAIAGFSKPVYNTLFLGQRIVSDDISPLFVRCAFRSDAAYGKATFSNDCVRVIADKLAVDANGVPVVGANAAIDAADPQCRSDICGTTDAAGGPRVANAKMDIGCFETDWKPRYSKDLARRRLTVIEAASEVYEGAATNSVVIPSGTVALDWENAPGVTGGKNKFKTQVSGTGTLYITLNGAAYAAVTCADGLKSLEFDISKHSVNVLAFTYEPGENDEGAAEISCFESPAHGLALVFR